MLSCLQEREEFFEVMTRNPKCSEVFIDFVEGSLLNLPREGSLLEPSVRAVQLFMWKMKWIPTDPQNSWEIRTFLIIRMRSMYDFQNFLSWVFSSFPLRRLRCSKLPFWLGTGFHSL